MRLLCSDFELRLIPHGEPACRGIAQAQEMTIAFVKGTDRHHAGRKAEALIEAGIAEDKDGRIPDHLLAQGKAQQLRAYPLSLKFRLHRQGGQMQAADSGAVVGLGESDIGDDRIDMETH